MNQLDAGDQSGWNGLRKPTNWPVIGAVAALHLLGLLVLLRMDTVRETVAEAAPMIVRFILTPAAEKSERPLQKPQIAPRPIVHDIPRPSIIRRTAPRAIDIVPPESAPTGVASTESEAVTPPGFGAAYLNNPAPDYPPVSQHLGESGLVKLLVLVDANGLPEQIEIDRSSGFERLDQAAIEAVRRWRFIPAKQGTQAVSARVIVPITFDLSR